MAWGDVGVAPFLEWFAGSVWEGLAETDQVRLSFILTRFALRFERMPEQGALIRWIGTLQRSRGGGGISKATMSDYYARLRFVYKSAVEAYPPAAQLAPLPYQSFRPKAWSRSGSVLI